MKRRMSSWHPKQNAYIENIAYLNMQYASAKEDTEAPQRGSVVACLLAFAGALQPHPLGLSTGLH